jgi:hypothetical protein
MVLSAAFRLPPHTANEALEQNATLSLQDATFVQLELYLRTVHQLMTMTELT